MADKSRRERVLDYLRKSPGRQFTVRELAEAYDQKYPEDGKRRMQETTRPIETHRKWMGILATEISSGLLAQEKTHPQLKKNKESKPRKYYWAEDNATGKFESTETKLESPEAENNQQDNKQQEKDFYDPLRQYLKDELGVRSVRINEKKSSNTLRGSNEWLHPDIVGMEDLVSGWKQEIKKLAKETNSKKARLWSFEVKVGIKNSDVRRYFFQAVANSSWANFGYLAVGEIVGKDTMNELRMLANLYGIGVITIDKTNPTNSNILIPARERDEIDLAACSRLAEANEDFAEFIQEIHSFYLTERINRHFWNIPK